MINAGAALRLGAETGAPYPYPRMSSTTCPGQWFTSSAALYFVLVNGLDVALEARQQSFTASLRRWLAAMKRGPRIRFAPALASAAPRMPQDFYASVVPSLSACVSVIRRGMRVITERKAKSSKKPPTTKPVAMPIRRKISNNFGSSSSLGRKTVSGG